MASFFHNLLDLLLDAAPWVLLGLLAAGAIKALNLEQGISRWLGGRGFWPVVRAALLGAPLPLCSCGVLPAAMAVRRNGASRSATVSFLIATPETGVDSVALSYALLGPFLTIIRPVAAIFSAILAGLLVLGVERDTPPRTLPIFAGARPTPDCGCAKTGCCPPVIAPSGWRARLISGLHYAFSEILDDLTLWLGLGLLAAALIQTLIPPASLAAWGGGWPAMLVMLVVGIPMYICATASTPLAASLILAGLSPGAALVFLLAGPATNAATIVVVQRELGTPTLIAYLLGITLSSLGFGFLTDALFTTLNLAGPSPGGSGEIVPLALAAPCALLLVLLTLRPLRRGVFALLPQES